MSIVYLVISLLASIIGAICGVGGGIIIKPALDAMGTLSVSTINFLSGCTVLAMSVVSVIKSSREKDAVMQWRIGMPLSLGAVLGGILGKEVFQYTFQIFSNENYIRVIQSMALIAITFATIIYTVNQKRIKTHQVKSVLVCTCIGLLLGVISSFLGIGGGPINLIVLSYFFTMGTKQAAANSLYIIMFSQLSSIGSTLISHQLPKIELMVLFLMVLGGVLGGALGRNINQKIEEKTVNNLFITMMAIIIVINVYIVIKFMM